MTEYKKTMVRADPFPFRVGNVRIAYPGTLNGEPTLHDPRPEFEIAVWDLHSPESLLS